MVFQKIKFENNRICDACQKGKQTRSSFKLKDLISSKNPLDILHVNLFGPSRTSFGGNLHALVIVDDFSRYT